MASAFDTRFAAARSALMAEHGIAVTRWPRGASGSAAAVTALWSPTAVTRRASMDGESEAFDGTLQVADSVEVHRADRWVIGDGLYAVAEPPGDAVGGLLTLALRRVEKVSTSRHDRGTML